MSNQSNDNSSIRDSQQQPNKRQKSDPVNGRNGGGGAGGGVGGTDPPRTHSKESLGFSMSFTKWDEDGFEWNDESDGLSASEPDSPSRGQPAPVDQYSYGLPLYNEHYYKKDYNQVDHLHFVPINNIIIDRSPADGGAVVEPLDFHPYSPDSGILVGVLVMHNLQRRALLVSRVTLSNGYLGVVTTFEALYQVGLTGELYSDPGLHTITSMAQATAAQSPVCVRLVLHDEKLLAQLKRMAYPFPVSSSFEVIKLPKYGQSAQNGPSNGDYGNRGPNGAGSDSGKYMAPTGGN